MCVVDMVHSLNSGTLETSQGPARGRTHSEQELWTPFLQKKQEPHAKSNAATTRSPFLMSETALPTSSTIPCMEQVTSQVSHDVYQAIGLTSSFRTGGTSCWYGFSSWLFQCRSEDWERAGERGGGAHHKFVPNNVTLLHARHEASVHVEVRATDSCAGDAKDCIILQETPTPLFRSNTVNWFKKLSLWNFQ